jgi:hypothetical protein
LKVFQILSKKLFRNQLILFSKNIVFLTGFVEHKVPLPGGGHPSQNDIFVLAKSNKDLVAITVEGKVSESFGETGGDWLKIESEGKKDNN